LRIDIRLVLPLIIGFGFAGCGSGSRSGSEDVSSLPDGMALLPDGAAASAEAATPADAGSSTLAEASTDRPTGAVDAGSETVPPQADASNDRAATPPDVALAADSLQVTPDLVAVDSVVRMDAAEALSRPDTDGLDAAKPADVMAVDTAKPPTDLAPATLGEMSPQQLHAALANKDFLLIDVHTPNAGSIPGTDARIAYSDIPALVAFIGPNLDTKVVLTCRSGGMSKQAGNALVARGYRNISELTGGTDAWTNAGYPLVRLDAGT
jgi:rhodanese-related sulfurtransferase